MNNETFTRLIDICRTIADIDNTEVGNAIERLCDAAESLNGLGENFRAQMVLLIAGEMSQEFLQWLSYEHWDWQRYNMVSPEIFGFFSLIKMSEKEYNSDGNY